MEENEGGGNEGGGGKVYFEEVGEAGLGEVDVCMGGIFGLEVMSAEICAMEVFMAGRYPRKIYHCAGERIRSLVFWTMK